MEWEENALTPTHFLQHAILCSLMILELILLDDTQASFNEWLSQNAVYLAFALAGFILLCVLLLLFIPVAKKKKKSKKAVIAKAQTMDALGGEENVLSHLRKGSRIELKLKNYDLLKKDELKMCYELKKIKPFKQDSFLLKIDVGSHAARNAKSGCYRRSD